MESREARLHQLATTNFDLLVIGGGATGTGIALDAATRGLRCALIERDDFASGTSSRSTKLIHGGVRYLESAIKHFDRQEFHLVSDALHERKTLLNIAPHLTRPLALLTPLYHRREIPYYLAGLKLYDWISRAASLGPSRYLNKQETIETFPHVHQENLKGAVLYFDGQFDDARMNVALAMTAANHGATIANHVELIDLKPTVRDTLTGEIFSLRAKKIINATGPFADAICCMDDPEHEPLIQPSSGVHLILDQELTPPGTGLLIPHTEDGRVLFLLPWEGSTLAGTTDNPCEIESTPRPTHEEVEYILRHIRQYCDGPLRVRAAWSGIRPLVSEQGKGSAQLHRDHLVHTSKSGLITIVGGKWTTYRSMAEDAVHTAFPEAPPSTTATTLLEGAEGFDPNTPLPVDEDIAKHLLHSYGSHAPTIAQGNTTRLLPHHPFIEEEVLHAIHHEYACTPIDVLARRMRLAFLDQQGAIEALPRVAELMDYKESLDKARAFLATMGA